MINEKKIITLIWNGTTAEKKLPWRTIIMYSSIRKNKRGQFVVGILATEQYGKKFKEKE